MAKFQDIRALAKQQLQAVTKNGECWKAFLHTAAIAYNYNFPNQLLIYCQNPTATAVADMEYWNKEAGRQVKRGAHGIPILDGLHGQIWSARRTHGGSAPKRAAQCAH